MIVNLAKVDEGLVVVANPAFATILAGTGAVAKVKVVPDSPITPLTKRLYEKGKSKCLGDSCPDAKENL